MSIKRQLRILLAVIIARSAIAAPAGVPLADSQPAACVQEPDSTFAVAPDTNPTTPVLKSALAAIQKANASLAQAQFDVYQKTTAGTLPTSRAEAAQLRTAAIRLKQAMNTSVSPSQIGLMRAIVQSYVNTAGNYLSVLAYQNPYEITNFKQAQLMVQFTVPTSLWTQLNLDQPIGQAEVISLNPQDAVVSLTPEKIYSIISDAAASADQLQISGKDNFEATRCVIAEQMVEQYFLQEQVRGVPPARIALSLPPSARACLGMPVSEVESWQRARAAEGSETLFRLAIADGTVTADKVLPQAMTAFLNSHLAGGAQLTVPDLTALIINPYYYNVGKFSKVTPPLTAEDSQNLASWLTQATDAAEKAAPYYGPLMTMTQSPLFASTLQSLISSCNTTYAQSNNPYMPAEKFKKMQRELNEHLSLIEKSLGLQLIEFVKFYVGRLESLDEVSARSALRQMLIYKKYLDARILFGQFYAVARENSSPPTDQVINSISDSLYQLASETVDQALAQKPVLDWFNGIVARFAKLRSHATTSQMSQPDGNFYSSSFALALKAEFIYSSKTPNSEIPFNPHIMAFTRAPYLQNSLSALNIARFRVVLQQSRYEGMRSAWSVVSSHLATDARNGGYDCKPPSRVRADSKAIGKIVLSAFGISFGKNALSPNAQCVLMHDTADMMGLNPQAAPFKSLQDAVDVLQTKLSGAALKSEIQQYKIAYVKQLILPDVRFLTLRYSSNRFDHSAPYLFEKIANAKSPSIAAQRIDWGLRFIDYNLAQEARTYLVAENMNGLIGFLNDADGLPNLLESQPAIKAFVEAEQANISRTTGIGWSVYDNYMATIKTVFSWYFAYWMAQNILAAPLRTVATKFSVMRALPAFMSQIEMRMAPVMTRMFLPMAIYAQTLLDVGIQSSRILVNDYIHMDAVNELYFSQGVNTRSGIFMTDDGYRNGTGAIQYANDNSKWSMISDGVMIVFMGGALGSIGAYNASLSEVNANWFRRAVDWTMRRPGLRARQLEAAIASGNPAAVQAAEETIINLGRNDRIDLEGAIRALDLGYNPTLTLANLNERLSAIEASGNFNRINDARAAYNQIVSVIGGRAEQMGGNSALKIYAQSVIGPNATVQDLWDLHAQSAKIGMANPMAGGSQ